ncbi:C40 family peptidase [Acidiferrimicrobium sp. IK]|uniref:C40 family peptidase n=1 Tax=Acidiferrimicrobium sp. IK TaxID=2871700 RepID=UPI0021CB3375|nr:C40 family peptidase [Acidiferrimicrobium sp. IK]
MSIALDDSAASGLATKLAAVAGGLCLLVALLAAGAGAGIASLLGGGAAAPSASATSAIPPAMLALYQQAATTCPGLPWTVLAAIGTVESGNGTSTLPGVHSGANSAGAEGDMQELASTFAEYDQPVPPGGAAPPSPYDPTDAVYAAARMLCANGAANGANLNQAIFDYNHATWYVSEVMSLAQTYGQTQAQTVAAGTAGGVAVDWALAQVGTPYIWGGETPGVGFDCSGLVQAAYKVAGISLPRVAQDQYDRTTKLGPGNPVEPGDLIFFGGGPSDVTHVGIYVGNGQMVDAPHTGADVRVEATPTTPGASWGTDVVVGVTDPAA